MGCFVSSASERAEDADGADAGRASSPERALGRVATATRDASASAKQSSTTNATPMRYQVRLRGGPLTQEEYNARLSGVRGPTSVRVSFDDESGGGKRSYAMRYAVCSQRGYYPESTEKPNQDAYATRTHFRGERDEHLFGVFDGHGEFGTECAQFACERVQLELALREFGDVRGYEAAFDATNRALRKSAIDDSLSGTTGVVAHIKGRDMYVMNVGDSRATMGIEKRDDDAAEGAAARVETVDLSSDQTPFRNDECERVKAAGARVLTLDQLEGFKDPSIQCWGTEQDDDGDPPRLWAKNGMYPGTAFTRSLGDAVAERIGVIATPEIEHVRLNRDTKAVVIASDGVFEFIPSANVIKAALATDDPQQSAIALTVESYKLWLQYETRTDDITVIVILFEDFDDEPTPPSTPLKSVPSVGALFNFPDRSSALLSPFPTSARPSRRVMPTFTMQTRRSYRVVHPYGMPSDYSFLEKISLEDQMNNLGVFDSDDGGIVSILKTSFLFAGVSTETLSEIAKAMYRKRFYAGDVIVTQNDKSCLRAFYAVHKGSLTGRDNLQWLDDDGEEKKETTKVRKYGAAGERMCFNEQCMAHAQMPHETVTADSDGELWVLDFASYARVMRGDEDADVGALTRALRSVDTLKTVRLSQLRRIAMGVIAKRSKSLVKASRNDLIARQGQPLQAMHVLSSGEVACTVRANARDESEMPRVVLKLQSGQYFGERALSGSGAPCATNIQVLSDSVEVWRVTLGDVTRVIGVQEGLTRTMSSMSSHSDLNTSSPDLLRQRSRIEGKDAHERRLSFGDDDRATREALYMTLLGHMRETKGALKEATVQISIARTESLNRVEGVLRERAIIQALTAANPPSFIPVPGIPSKDASFISIPYPFVPRCALEAVIACGGGSKPVVVRYYMAALTLLLEYVHSFDIVFRGMDPETMTIDEHGALRLTDFRFAKRLSASDGAPGRTFTSCGAAAYMAPEVVKGLGHDERADWFSLGAFLAHLLRGSPPFGMTVGYNTYRAICECNLTDVFRTDADPIAVSLAQTLLVVHPDDRPRDAQAVKSHALFAAVDWDAVAARPPPPEIEALTRDAYRGRGVPPIRDATEPSTSASKAHHFASASSSLNWCDAYMSLDTIAP
jgi:serine/threonine protein phosphatase PrpC/serine/threonine protein kinase